MAMLTGWMRLVGVFYLLLFVLVSLVHVPIDAEGPPGALALAAAGDPLARFVVDTWVALGLQFGVLGVALLVASRMPHASRALAWTVIALEVVPAGNGHQVRDVIHNPVQGVEQRAWTWPRTSLLS